MLWCWSQNCVEPTEKEGCLTHRRDYSDQDLDLATRQCRKGNVLQGHSTVRGSQHDTDTGYVGAGRPCKALLGRRVRKSHVRNVVARSFTT